LGGEKMVENVNNKVSQPADLNRVPKKVLDKEDFMKLFITQLQYQDPMKPIDNNEMAMQLALFNQVDQLFNINDNLKQLMDMAGSLNISFASSLIGKKVKVETNIGRVENGKFLGGEFTLDEPVNSAEIVIRDSKGKIVKKIELTSLQEGTHKIEWDATDENGETVPDGNYTFSIVIPEGDNTKPITPVMIARVTGAKLEKDNTQLVINDAENISLTDIKEIIGG
jgi:flagellar basal-body rod modification protein FlgD